MKIFIAVLVLGLVAIQCKTEEFRCQSGVPYVENECNNCACSEEGNLGCTMMLCPNPRTTKLQNCQVGITYERHCNRCWCLENFGTICTKHECD